MSDLSVKMSLVSVTMCAPAKTGKQCAPTTMVQTEVCEKEVCVPLALTPETASEAARRLVAIFQGRSVVAFVERNTATSEPEPVGTDNPGHYPPWERGQRPSMDSRGEIHGCH